MFNINDSVKIKNKNIFGKITSIDKNKVIFLTEDGKTVNCDIDKIEKITIPKKKSKVTVKYDFEIPNTSFVNEIMLRHMHKEEAIITLDRFISEAIMNKEKKVKIVHGKHGGVLREAVHEYLKNSKYVERYELARIF